MAILKKHRRLVAVVSGLLLVVVVLVVFVASKAKPVPAQPGPLEVSVVKVEQRDVPIYSEWIATLDGMVNADIKPQVSGYLLNKNYTEGSFVQKGQLMFEIDPRPFQAALEQARGDLARAEGQLAQSKGQLLQSDANLLQAQANQGKSQLDVNRFTPLAKEGIIPPQELDNAVQTNKAQIAQVKAASAGIETSKAAIRAAEAQVKSAQAAVKTAELNLGFTRILAPISGIAGIAKAQVGDLVNPSSEPLTTVSTVDPIKAYYSLSEREYLAHTRSDDLQVVVVDGTTYPQKGKFYLANREVDPSTGAIRLAGIFPNPSNVLRPGQYGRVRAVTSTKTGALLVPQRAVTELQGSFTVAVVDAENKVSIRPVKVGERVDTMWIINEGLNPGETVVAEGTQKVKPDQVIVPKPFVPAPEAEVKR